MKAYYYRKAVITPVETLGDIIAVVLDETLVINFSSSIIRAVG